MSYYKACDLYHRQTLPQSNLVTEVTVMGDRKEQTKLDIKYETLTNVDPGKPDVFGPPMWFTLHNGAAHYPVKASAITAERMKGFIMGLPVMIPCETCSNHATAHIESNFKKLDYIVSGREQLFKFFVDFHNYVNARYGKPQMSLEDAYKIYTSPTTVSKMTYKMTKN